MRDDFPKIVLDDTRALPVPRLGESDCPEDLWETLPTGRTAPPTAFREVLGQMALRMMDVHRQRRCRQSSFETRLCSLVSNKGSDSGLLDALSGKTLLRDLFGDPQKRTSPQPFDAVIDLLRRNRRKIRPDALSDGVLRRIHTEYSNATQDMIALRQEALELDRGIDRAVYQAHGLTSEQVRIIEQDELVI